MADKHIFALYYQETSTIKSQQRLEIYDDQIVHRIKNVLRLIPGEVLVIFDQKHHASCILECIEKKGIVLTIKEYSANVVFKPHITVVVPILKKDAWDNALYSCVELGASSIIPYFSHKTRRNLSQKDHERAQKIIIAAAEQSKHFAFPALYKERSFDEVSTIEGTKIFFDVHGDPIKSVINKVEKASNLVLMIGPEGDLLKEEKMRLKNAHFLFCSLTRTVLRAQQAAALSLGIFRSFL